MISSVKRPKRIRLDGVQKRIGASMLIKIGGTLLAFLLNLLLARVLGVEDYGLYSFTFTILMAFALVGGLGLDKSSIKYLSGYLQNKQYHKYSKFKHAAYLSIVLSSVVISVSMLAYHFSQGGVYSRSAFFWAALLLPIICFVSLQSSVLRVHNKITHAQIPQDLLRPLIIIVSVLVANYGLGLALGFDEILIIVVFTHLLLSVIYFRLVVNAERGCNTYYKEAKIERENMLKDAREIKTKLIADAENQAKEQASKLIESAQLAIQNEKNSAMNELKQTVVELSVGIAEKVISSELEDKNKQLKVVENMLNDASLNN